MKTIVQKIVFKAPPKELFELYMDSKKHSLISGGAKAVLSRKAGGSFSVHGGYCKGKNLLLVPNKMIVQTWRASNWSKSDLDSIFILTFEKVSGGTEVTMVHADVPDKEAKHLTKGWHDHYWTPWKKYLANL
jgi:activator of HSP90 ATPase